MKILGLGVPELVVILIVVLLIFGPKNLPKLGSAIGKTFKNLREGMDGKDSKKEKEDGDLQRKSALSRLLRTTKRTHSLHCI